VDTREQMLASAVARLFFVRTLTTIWHRVK
jgi:hypothetical protein